MSPEQTFRSLVLRLAFVLILLGNFNDTNTYKEASLPEFVLTAVRELKARGTTTMDKFIRQNFSCATSFKTLISRLP